VQRNGIGGTPNAQGRSRSRQGGPLSYFEQRGNVVTTAISKYVLAVGSHVHVLPLP
jgi:hypothetical protein